MKKVFCKKKVSLCIKQNCHVVMEYNFCKQYFAFGKCQLNLKILISTDFYENIVVWFKEEDTKIAL